jgi:hypothetical protein
MRNSRAVTAGLILVVIAGAIACRIWWPDAPDGQSSSIVDRSPATSRADDADSPAVKSRKPAYGARAQDNSASNDSSSADSGAQLDLHSIRACHDALLSKTTLDTLGVCEKTPGGQPVDIQFCRDSMARVAKQATDALASAGSCPPELLNASVYYEAIKRLAVLGDIPAQRCFITGYFAGAVQEGDEARLRPEQADEYLVLAKKFIEEGLERGDWSVVRWLARSRTGLQDGMLISAYPFGINHPETAYRMNYLLMLGNQHNFEESVDPRQFIELWQPDKDLSAPKLKEAQDWARNMYDQHFNGSQEGASLEQMCEH